MLKRDVNTAVTGQHATAGAVIALDTYVYVQAVTDEKREAQNKVVKMLFRACVEQ